MRMASISGTVPVSLRIALHRALGEPFCHYLGDLGHLVELREEPLHLLTLDISPELLGIRDLEGHDVAVGGRGARAEQPARPVIPPVFDRGEVPHRRGVGLENPAFVGIGADAILEVDQHDDRHHPDLLSIVFPQGCQASLDEDLVHVAPPPVFPRLEGPHYRVIRRVEMLCGVLVLGRVAAGDVPAGQALAQVYPGVAHLQALLAPLRGWRYVFVDLTRVRTPLRKTSEHRVSPFTSRSSARILRPARDPFSLYAGAVSPSAPLASP